MFDRKVWQPMLDKTRDYVIANFPESNEKKALLFYFGEWRYHFWHNSPPMPKWAYATDIDFVELGNGLTPLALMEVKTFKTSKPNWQTEVHTNIAQKLNIPYYQLHFPITLDTFTLSPIYPNQKSTKLTEIEMQGWLCDLRKQVWQMRDETKKVETK